MLDKEFVFDKITDKIKNWRMSDDFMFDSLLEDIYYNVFDNIKTYNKDNSNMFLWLDESPSSIVDGILLNDNLVIDFSVDDSPFLNLNIYVLYIDTVVKKIYNLNIIKEEEFINLFYLEVINKLQVNDDFIDNNLLRYFAMFCIRFVFRQYGEKNLGFAERSLYDANEKMLNL